MLAFYKTHPMVFGGYYNYTQVLGALTMDLYVSERDDLLPKYLDILEAWLATDESQFVWRGYHKSHFHFIRGEYPEAYDAGMEQLDQFELAIFGEQPV